LLLETGSAVKSLACFVEESGRFYPFRGGLLEHAEVVVVGVRPILLADPNGGKSESKSSHGDRNPVGGLEVLSTFFGTFFEGGTGEGLLAEAKFSAM